MGTKMADLHELEDYGALDFTNLPSISPQSDFSSFCFVGSAYDHAKYRNFFGFESRLSSETLHEENSPARTGQEMVNRRSTDLRNFTN